MSTPAADGFHLPADWAKHQRCWMAWPCRLEVWGKRLDVTLDAFAEAAEAISRFEPVTVIARGDEVAEVSMRTSSRVPTLALAHDGSALRDNGPFFVVDGKGGVAGVQFGFNGWGERFKNYADDAAVPQGLLERLNFKRYVAPLILEGGAVVGDGEGTLLTTEQCLLHPNRNPGRSKQEIEQVLKDYLGARKIIWLAGDPSDMDTDGHVSHLACFAKPGQVLALHPGALNAPNHEALSENLRRLRSETDANGRKLEIVELPQTAKPIKEYHGGEAHQSYLTFYLANGGVLAPIYEDANDQKALDLITGIFKDREVVPLPCRELAYGADAIRALTLAQPAV